MHDPDLIAASSLALAALQHAAAAATPPQAQKPGTDVGIESRWMDKSVKPGDDFYKYANGSWVKNAVIPADRSSIGGFWHRRPGAREEHARAVRRNSQVEPGGGRRRAIANYYKAYLNTDAIDRAG